MTGAVINASFVPIVYFLFPETGGRSLEQIDHIFEGKGQGWSGLTQGVRESTRKPLADTSADFGRSTGLVVVEMKGDKDAPTRADVEYVEST